MRRFARLAWLQSSLPSSPIGKFNLNMSDNKQEPVASRSGSMENSPDSDPCLWPPLGGADTGTIPAFSLNQFNTNHSEVLRRHHFCRHCDHLHEPYAALSLLVRARERSGSTVSSHISDLPQVDEPSATCELHGGVIFGRVEGPAITETFTSPREPKP